MIVGADGTGSQADASYRTEDDAKPRYAAI
jgi:hypothetical protein